MKVQDLAKEFSISTRDLLKFIRDINIKVKSGSTRLAASTVGRIRSQYQHRVQSQQNNMEVEQGDPVVVVLTHKTIKVSDLVRLFKFFISFSSDMFI